MLPKREQENSFCRHRWPRFVPFPIRLLIKKRLNEVDPGCPSRGRARRREVGGCGDGSIAVSSPSRDTPAGAPTAASTSPRRPRGRNTTRSQSRAQPAVPTRHFHSTLVATCQSPQEAFPRSLRIGQTLDAPEQHGGVCRCPPISEIGLARDMSEGGRRHIVRTALVAESGSLCDPRGKVLDPKRPS